MGFPTVMGGAEKWLAPGAGKDLVATHADEVGVHHLTPELSRADLRPWASETQWYLHEAAKRARLERIVRHGPAKSEVFAANMPTKRCQQPVEQTHTTAILRQ